MAVISALLLAVGCVAQDAPPMRWNVRDFGAVGDGATDDTAVFQSTLDAAGDAGGGIVFAPRGDYLIETHLVIRDFVTLEGVFTAPTAWSQNHGTTLLAVEGEGTEEGEPFIMLGTNGTLKGITVYYPNQDDPENIRAYPWCVAGSGRDNPTIIDCLLVNPYNAVDFGTRNSGRHYIRNLYGQPLRRGIFVDKCYDVGRIENVHFWPFWGQWGNEPLREWLTTEAEAFIFGRTDWQYVLNCFVFGYHIGYRFIDAGSGSCNGNFLGIGSDASGTAVQIDSCSPIGLLITNGEFVAMMGEDPVSVRVGESCAGDVSFVNSAFWGPSEQILNASGSGTVTFQACNFRDWDRGGSGKYALEATNGQLVVQACNFSKPAPHVRIGPNVLSGVVVANRFAGEAIIANESEGSVQIGLNAETVVEEGSVTLGGTNEGRFVTQYEVEEAKTEAGEANGRQCRVQQTMYMMFLVASELAGSGRPPTVSVEVTYLDEGEGVFFLQYDSLDETVLVVPQWPGAFKSSEQIELTGTGEWLTALFEIDDALFAGRCNGADFRITSPTSRLSIAEVKVSRR